MFHFIQCSPTELVVLFQELRSMLWGEEEEVVEEGK